METRNILDQLGNTIGSLTLPDGTSESVWASALSIYSSNNIRPPIIKKDLRTYSATGSGSVTTSSGTPSTIEGMSLTVEEGTYLAQFNGSIYTSGASAIGEFGIYINGVLIPETKRSISCNLQLLGGLVTISLNAIGVGTISASEIQIPCTSVVDVRFKSVNGGTIGFNDRVFSLVKVK